MVTENVGSGFHNENFPEFQCQRDPGGFVGQLGDLDVQGMDVIDRTD